MMTFAVRLFLIAFVSSISASHQASTNQSVGCLFPDYPEGGEYTISSGCEGDRFSTKCKAIPGNLADSNTVITYNCFNSFTLDSSINVSLCFNGDWFPRTPSCLRKCKPLYSKSLIISCTYKDSPVDCTSQGALPGTKARLRCKPYYKPSELTFGFPICNKDGSWSESLTSCRPDCGVSIDENFSSLISTNERFSFWKYPWHAGLYRFDKTINDTRVFCSGTIITPNMILTAAHCVYDIRLQPGELYVAVRKMTRDWKIIDPGEQRFNVSRIITHKDYIGYENHYAFDIAMLELTQEIIIGKQIMPACIETTHPWTGIENGTVGTIVGWSKDETGELSSKLQVFHMPYLDHMSCVRQDGSFRQFITNDKFCASYDSKGTGVEHVESGGGLVFYKREVDRYFIRGIASTKSAHHNTFGTFTNISDNSHANFLRYILSD